MEVRLAGHTDLAGFRAEARQLLAQQVPPDAVSWTLDPAAPGCHGELQLPQASRPRHVARAASAIVPASFQRLCEAVVLHRDPARFALLYRLLWRLVHEPALRSDPLDPDMLQAQHLAHAVRRDIHKMKANLKLRTVQDAEGELQVGSFEPAHHIVDAVAPWLLKRLSTSRWALFTPQRSMRAAAGQLAFGQGVPAAALPAFDADDAEWLACYARVFAQPAAPAHA